MDLWTSHEGLLLDYEEPLTRRDSLTGDWYDCSAHMLWIGERTRQPDGAHVAFFSGVHNPIGVKLGPAATPEDVLELCELLNPRRIAGRLTLITRMGVERVAELLPPLLRAASDSGAPRRLGLRPDAREHDHDRERAGRRAASTTSWRRSRASSRRIGSEGTWPGGVHLEFTGDDVTECIGGAEAVLEEQLDGRYMTLCDPRLNARQSLDLAFRVAEN